MNLCMISFAFEKPFAIFVRDSDELPMMMLGS